MDASAYLKRQGWRGHGHSLDHSDRGIKKPLLVSKKVDALGVGLNKHSTVSDQWWLRAFDQGLRNLGTGEESVLATVQKHGINRGGLYGRFVKGDRIAGSIGQTPLGSAETTGTNTPTEITPNMAIDIPPEDKLERVVGMHNDKNSHDAMMYMLQHPEDAPASMRRMLDRKRKRAERPVEKRARRKIERTKRRKEEALEYRKQAIEDGTWDAEEEEEKRKTKEINKQAKEFVLEAQRRGIIPLGPNEIRKGIVPYENEPNATDVSRPGKHSDGMQQVFDQVRLHTQVNLKGSGKNSLKAQKYAREKMKRELKRAAKAYLMGEKPPHELTLEEKKAKKAKKKEHSAQKRTEAAKIEAERMAMREERAAQNREKRLRKRAENEQVSKIMEERDAALAAGKTLDEYYAERAEREAENGSEDEDSSGAEETENGVPTSSSGNAENGADAFTDGDQSRSTEFETGADEIKFGMTRKGGKKKVPGIGFVDRYPTKAEKKAKKLKAMAIKSRISDEEMKARLDADKAEKQAIEQTKIDKYRAMKHGMSLEEYRTALSKGDVYPPCVEKKKIPPEKLAEYNARATEKGISLEDYIRRREDKNAAKQSEKLGNPFQRDIVDAAKTGMEYIAAEPEQENVSNPNDVDSTASAGLGFIIDTEGDDKLASFPDRARAVIREGKPLAIVDTAGNETYSYTPNMPVPLDPRIWEGRNVKDLPKAVRKARRDWMAVKREEKKSRATENGAHKKLSQKQAKGQRKIAAREAFVKQVLFHSRNALRENASASGMVTIDGVQNVPLLKVESTHGIFKKDEINLARTVARRVLRTVKREQRAKDGKGKGWKKRERAMKEAARNAGISGFTDKARFEPGGNRNLLL